VRPRWVLMQSHVIAEIDGPSSTSSPGTATLIPLERPQELSDRIAGFRDTIIGS
jgi:hypothetical protein